MAMFCKSLYRVIYIKTDFLTILIFLYYGKWFYIIAMHHYIKYEFEFCTFYLHLLLVNANKERRN